MKIVQKTLTVIETVYWPLLLSQHRYMEGSNGAKTIAVCGLRSVKEYTNHYLSW